MRVRAIRKRPRFASMDTCGEGGKCGETPCGETRTRHARPHRGWGCISVGTRRPPLRQTAHPLQQNEVHPCKKTKRQQQGRLRVLPTKGSPKMENPSKGSPTHKQKGDGQANPHRQRCKIPSCEERDPEETAFPPALFPGFCVKTGLRAGRPPPSLKRGEIV